MHLKIFVDFALPPEARARLEEGAAGHELIFPSKPATSVLAKSAPDPAFYEADVAFGQPEPSEIAKSASLKWIHVSSSGITRYDNAEFRAAISERGIPVSNSASVYNEACADHALCFMLAESRQLPQGLASKSASGSDEWLRLRRSSVSLKGQRVVILGYGAIGSRLAELLKPFAMKLVAFRRKARGDEAMPVVGQDGLPAELAIADHVVNILPDSPATADFFDQKRFAQCKPGSVFYNIGRGTTVNQDDLHQTLESGHLKAAWLDVTEPEPLPSDHPLRSLPNCHITPHTAGGHLGEATTCVNHFLENLQRFTKGQAILDRVM